MKFLIIDCLLCFAAADILQRAAPAVDQTGFTFMEGAEEEGSFNEPLHVNDLGIQQFNVLRNMNNFRFKSIGTYDFMATAKIDGIQNRPITNDVKVEVDKKVKEAMREELEKIKESIDEAKSEVLKEVKELRQKLDDLSSIVKTLMPEE